MSSNRNAAVMPVLLRDGRERGMTSLNTSFRRCGSAPLLVRLLAWAMRG